MRVSEIQSHLPIFRVCVELLLRVSASTAASYGFWPFTEFPEVACPSSCATALATRDPGRNRSNTTLDRDQSRIGADVRAVRPHNLLPNCLDRCSFCAPCLSSCQQIRAARLRHPCCGQATVAAAKKKPHSTRGPGTKGNSRCSYRSHLRQLGAALL